MLLERLYGRRRWEGGVPVHFIDVAVVGVVSGAPTTVKATIRCAADWLVIDWRMEIDSGNDGHTALSSREGHMAGTVHRHSGSEQVEVAEVDPHAFPVWDGCASAHLAILQSSLHGHALAFEVPVLHVTLGNAQVRAGRRSYTSHGPRGWTYEDLGLGGGRGEIEVDEDGVVIQEIGVSRLIKTRFPRPAPESSQLSD